VTTGEPFLRTALLALDEANDPTFARPILENALVEAAPLVSLHRPASAKKVVTWAAQQMAMHADTPARAYSRLRELLAALFEPLAGSRPIHAPAPEVALAMPPAALLEALAPAPRVLARALAVGEKLDARGLLADPELARRVLGIRAIPTASLGSYANELAAVIAGVPLDTHPREQAPAADATNEPARATHAPSTTVRAHDPVDEDDDLAGERVARGATRIRDAAFEAVAGIEAGILRAEAIAICAPAADKVRAKLAAALAPYLTATNGDVRAAAIDGLHALKTRLDDAQLLAGLRDPIAAVRAAAARTIATGPFVLGAPRPTYPTEIIQHLIALVDDVDPAVRNAALGAITRYPAMHGPELVEPMRAVIRRGGDESRAAIYLLGRLGAQATTAAIDIVRALASATHPQQVGEALIAVLAGDASVQVVETLRACVTGPRSSAAYTARVVLDKLGVASPELPLEARLARASDELASDDRDAQWSGLFEIKRIGKPAAELIPAIRALGDRVAVDPSTEARATLSQVRDVLGELGVEDLPLPPSRLEAYRGIAPREVAVHGAYAIAAIAQGTVTSLGLWDHGTGKRLFVVERGEALAFIPGRTEIAVIRTELKRGWNFERYRVPTGERLASLAIPKPLTYGSPSELAIAADLATVWCDDNHAPYRFHIKLGDPDTLLDEAPILGGRSRKKS
jgi:hypothetical protein